MRFPTRTATILLLAVGLSGCQQSDPPDKQASNAAEPENTAPAANVAHPNVHPAAADGFQGNGGRIVTLVNVTGYSYIEVENEAGQRVWIAAPPTQVSEGDVVAWNRFALMKDFHSEQLGRDFDQILFVSQLYWPAGADQQPPENRGTVLSVQNAANYSYLEIENKAGQVVWVAVPETPVSVSDSVAWHGGSLMRNFTSNSLDRTFPEIIFASSVTVDQ